MPTAARLLAAVAFAALGFLAAETVKPHMVEGTQFGVFSYICAGIGALCGWMVMGGLVGAGYRAAAGYGVRTAATLVFWALLGFSLYEMILRATKMRYDGPMDALTGVFDIALGYGETMLHADVIGVLLVGGMAGGMLAEWAARRWA